MNHIDSFRTFRHHGYGAGVDGIIGQAAIDYY
jgi:hypothetical protein